MDTPQSRTWLAPTGTKKISHDDYDDDDIHLDAVEEEDDPHDEGRHHAPAAHPNHDPILGGKAAEISL